MHKKWRDPKFKDRLVHVDDNTDGWLICHVDWPNRSEHGQTFFIRRNFLEEYYEKVVND